MVQHGAAISLHLFSHGDLEFKFAMRVVSYSAMEQCFPCFPSTKKVIVLN